MLPPTLLRSTHPAEDLLDGSQALAFLLLAIIVLVVLSIGTIRLAPSGQQLVVLRHGIIRRTPRGRFALTIPGAEQVALWPGTPVEEALQIRAGTRDGAEVRVLAEVTLDLSPPMVGDQHQDPVAAAVIGISTIVENAVETRDLDDLLDPVRGLQPALAGQLLDSGATITRAEIVEVEVLLGDRAEGRA